MTHPRFIVLEGIDGSGTTTQSAALAAALRDRGHAVHETREPSRGPVGATVRDQLAISAEATETVDPATLALLFAADRLDHLKREIDPALASGQLVLCDRYLLSSYAYQGLHCPPDWISAINRRAPPPDLTLFLDLDADTAMARVAGRSAETGVVHERFDDLRLQRRLATSYRRLAAVVSDGTAVVRVDGSPPQEAVLRHLVSICAAAGL